MSPQHPSDSSALLTTRSLCFWVLELQAGRPNAAKPVFDKILAAVKIRTQHAFRQFSRVGRFADLDDVLQGAMMRLLRSMQAIRPKNTPHFYKLVNRFIRYELLDLIKKYYGVNGAGRKLTDRAVDLEVAMAFDPDAELDRMTAFHEAVEKLPEKWREAFSLDYYHGWSQVDIGNLFDVHQRTVSRWQKKAIAQLGEQVGDVI